MTDLTVGPQVGLDVLLPRVNATSACPIRLLCGAKTLSSVVQILPQFLVWPPNPTLNFLSSLSLETELDVSKDTEV